MLLNFSSTLSLRAKSYNKPKLKEQDKEFYNI